MVDISFRARVSGNGRRIYLDDGTHLDISWYEDNWVVDVHMGHWQHGNLLALSEVSKVFFRFDKLLPRTLCEKYYTFRINRMTTKIAGVKIIN